VNIPFLPWGTLEWMSSVIKTLGLWDFLGCLSTEDRSLSAWQWLCTSKLIRTNEFWAINDLLPKGSEIEALSKTMLNRNTDAYFAAGGTSLNSFDLFDSDGKAWDQIDQLIDNAKGNIIIDISSFPKRWFFPIIKACIESNNVKNMLVLYTIPNVYDESSQGMSTERWSRFLGFGHLDETPEEEKHYIISAGYQPMSLPEYIGERKPSTNKPDGTNAGPYFHILFPFPSSPLGLPRLWDFVRAIEKDVHQHTKIHYIPGFNLPSIYSSIMRIMRISAYSCFEFAPYGPKPISLAMAILSTLHAIPIGYTQPKYYNPKYTEGVRYIDAMQKTPLSYAYLIKLNGQTLYK
jgi:hypothetical protein